MLSSISRKELKEDIIPLRMHKLVRRLVLVLYWSNELHYGTSHEGKLIVFLGVKEKPIQCHNDVQHVDCSLLKVRLMKRNEDSNMI